MDYRIIIDDQKYDHNILETCKTDMKKMGFTEDNFKKDFYEISLNFMDNGRKTIKLKTIVILDNDKNQLIGHAVCQKLDNSLILPDGLVDVFDKSGYIWGLHVLPDYRKKGYGKILIEECHKYLKKIGCKDVKLHASEMGSYLYKSMGYKISNEMKYDL